jgi:uncharacterized protein YjbJ (UPF0337 family)
MDGWRRHNWIHACGNERTIHGFLAIVHGLYKAQCCVISRIAGFVGNQRRNFMNMMNADEIKGKWKQHVGAAKIVWGKLTEDEILKSEGHVQKLAGLVQERYAITRDAADKQVKDFVEKHKYC